MTDALNLLCQVSGKQLSKKQIALRDLAGPVTDTGSFECCDNYSLWEWEGLEVVGVASNVEKRKRACCLAMSLEIASTHAFTAAVHPSAILVIGVELDKHPKFQASRT